MTVEEKVAQTIQADGASITPDELKKYRLGSVLVGGNSAPDGNDRATPQRWVEWIRAFRAAALAARRSPGDLDHLRRRRRARPQQRRRRDDLPAQYRLGRGPRSRLDPPHRRGDGRRDGRHRRRLDLWPDGGRARDERWGRAYEGYAEDPEVVKSYSGPMTLGLQGALVAGKPLTPGHAGGIGQALPGRWRHRGRQGSGRRQDLGGRPSAPARRRLSARDRRRHPVGMVSFSSWNGVKHTGNKSLLTDVLKGRLGFGGFVVGDWNAHGQVEGCTNTNCPQAYNAGMDMIMAPDSWKGLYDNTLAQVKSGQIPMARIDDAVRRILRVKVEPTCSPTSGRWRAI
ncbi:glycoside hydrolase family 3 N-terminal domain-containing protein [Caulobacter segnis]